MIMLVSSAKVAIKTRLKESQGGHALTPNNVVWPSSYACAQLYHPRNNLVPRVVSLWPAVERRFFKRAQKDSGNEIPEQMKLEEIWKISLRRGYFPVLSIWFHREHTYSHFLVLSVKNQLILVSWILTTGHRFLSDLVPSTLPFDTGTSIALFEEKKKVKTDVNIRHTSPVAWSSPFACPFFRSI